MIGTQILEGQGLGNRLFCYVTARCAALEKNAEFGLMGADILRKSLSGKNGEPYMDLWMGKEASPEDFSQRYEEKEERIFTGTCGHDLEHGCYVAGADEGVLKAADGTLLMGNLQAECYFEKYKEEIRKWLKVKPEYETFAYSRDNLCVLNMRGGEYTGEPALYLRKKYWTDAMKHMKQIRPDMEFMIVTDDVEAAHKLLPGIEAHHFTPDKDYVVVKNAKYLIISNSSFAFFPAYTSETVKKVIAPKYWARHNVSDGYWASEQNIYSGFMYLDRKGKLFSAEACKKELEEYKKVSAKFQNRKQKPDGLKKKWMKLEAAFFYKWYYAVRAGRSLKRRLKCILGKEENK
ncbi:MAG: glycosyl transferase [Lachnospiraceae bacterium]|nr:glycosyl transferase [Lachnospiraceae bacterium]